MNFRPPLLVTKILPFGPIAAPLGPPPRLAITGSWPSDVTGEGVWRSIATGTTEPSLIATGPSGKRRPDAICLSAGVIIFKTASWTSSSLRRARAQRPRVLRGPDAQELPTPARARLADPVEERELEVRRHRRQGFHVELIQGDRRVLGLEAGAPVGNDVIVGQVHPAYAGQHRADAITGDHGHSDLAARGFEHPAGRERLEAVSREPAVQHHAGVRPVDPAESEIGLSLGVRSQHLGQRRAERIVHDRDLPRQAELELGAGQARRHRVARQIALRQHEIAGTDRVLVDHLTVRRDAQELSPARPAEVFDLRTEAVRRAGPMNGESRVTARGRELVEAIAEAPGGASAERRERGARARVFDARVESREAARLSGAHRRSVGEAGAEVKENVARLDSLGKPAKVAERSTRASTGAVDRAVRV